MISLFLLCLYFSWCPQPARLQIADTLCELAPGRHTENILASHWYHWQHSPLPLPQVPGSLHWQNACCSVFLIPNGWWLWWIDLKLILMFLKTAVWKKMKLGTIFRCLVLLPLLLPHSTSSLVLCFWDNLFLLIQEALRKDEQNEKSHNYCNNF